MNNEWEKDFPPVSEVCLMTHRELSRWYQVEILAYRGNVVYILGSSEIWDKGIGAITINEFLKFKPLKLQADIQRENAIETIINDSCWVYDDKATDVMSVECAETLIDAGYHNGVKVGEEITGIGVAWGWRDCGNYKLEEYLEDNFTIYKK